jgi:nucleotide-binding universal stress UspA family protein
MFSSVLCPVDFSDQSVGELRYAAALAARGRGKVTAIHVAHPLLVEAAAGGADVSAVTGQIEGELRDLVQQVTTAAGSWAPPIEFLVATGDAADAVIVKHAVDHGMSLIVMGTYGLTGYRRLLLGSVTERVLRSASVPVLVVPQMEAEPVTYAAPGPVFAVERVLAPCDFRDQSRADLEVARQMSVTFDVPLLLLHVVEEISGPSRWRDSLNAHEQREIARVTIWLDEVAARLGTAPRIDTIVATGRSAEAIGKVAAEHNAGLIVMGLSGESGPFGSRPGTTAYRVLAMAAAPVLALPR